MPPSVGTLYELSRLDDEGWRAIEPHLSPELKRKDVRPFLPSKRNGSDGEIVIEDDRETCSVGDLSDLSRTFGTIYADPPWLYGNQGTRGSTGDHYSGMTPDEVAELPITHLVADTAHLHLWTTNAFLFDARRVMEAWGFDYKSCFVWVKPQMGMGNYWRVSHEFCLLGVRGSAPFRERDEMSWREWPRGRHSAKPGRMYDIIERVSPGPYLELFARRHHPGWTAWGHIEPDLFFEAAS